MTFYRLSWNCGLAPPAQSVFQGSAGVPPAKEEEGSRGGWRAGEMAGIPPASLRLRRALAKILKADVELAASA
jgi:hypothetical protein